MNELSPVSPLSIPQLKYHIDMRSFRMVGYVGLLLFSAGTAGALWARQYWPALGLAAFAVLGLGIVLGAGSFTIAIRDLHTDRFGEWQIQWSEVTGTEFGGGGTLVLLGANKQFVLSSPSWWAGPHNVAAAALVSDQLRALNVVPRLNRLADYKLMKHTRVRAT